MLLIAKVIRSKADHRKYLSLSVVCSNSIPFPLNYMIVIYYFHIKYNNCIHNTSLTSGEYTFSTIRLYLLLFVRGLVSYLHYLCVFAYSVVQHMLCCVFFSLRLLYPMCECVWVVHFLLSLQYSLMCIQPYS